MKVRLVADQDSVAPGSTITLGVHFIPDPDWHIYWKNAGDSGLGPRFGWRATEGLKVAEPLWPYPERIAVGPLANYGYSEVLIPFPVTISSALPVSGKASIELSTEWLVCKDECLPGEASLKLSLPVTSTPGAPSSERPLFESTFKRVPRPLEKVSIAVEEQDKHIVVALIPLGERFLPSTASFFPEDKQIILNSAPQQISKEGGALKITLARDPNRKSAVERIRGVLVSPEGWSESGEPKAVSIDNNPLNTPAEAEAPLTTASIPAPPNTPGLGIALVFAFIGGLILNLMPCVFPVLSIKILGFVQQSGEDSSKVRIHGVLFSIGVLISFWVLAGLLFALRAGGEQLGWGFQLQSPVFVVAMIFVFFTLGVLFLSDIAMGQALQRIAGSSRLPTSFAGSFLNGVLATAVATPCTAPFMSSALAATLTLPIAAGFLIFTAIALGMSTPYLLLSWNPRLLKLLPRPGVWMESFKHLMAFPLFATAIWLLRVFARQMGMEPSGLSVLMDVLWGGLLLGFGLWLFGRSTRSERNVSARLYQICAALSVIGAVYIALPTNQEINRSVERSCDLTDSPHIETDSFGLNWESFSPSRLEAHLAQGKSVYLDFTAEWCITCQVNERLVFGSQEVRDLVKEKGVILIRADWTSKNPAITKALQGFGRNGVPLNVLYSRGSREQPLIFPNIMTPAMVIEELKKLSS
jgi:thiol:disulfide interchange protein DsbD